MTQFCETCPLRGECVGEISPTVMVFDYADVEYPFFSKPIEHFRHMVELKDLDGNPSRLFHGVDEETIFERIDSCEGTYTEPTKRFLRSPVSLEYCSALGIRPNVAIHYAYEFREAMKNQLEGYLPHEPSKLENFIQRNRVLRSKKIAAIGTVAIGLGASTALWVETHNIASALPLIGTAVGVVSGNKLTSWLKTQLEADGQGEPE
jgi:hypothetical protein